MTALETLVNGTVEVVGRCDAEVKAVVATAAAAGQETQETQV